MRESFIQEWRQGLGWFLLFLIIGAVFGLIDWLTRPLQDWWEK